MDLPFSSHYRPFHGLHIPHLFVASLAFMAGITAAYYHWYWTIPVTLALPGGIRYFRDCLPARSFYLPLFFLVGFLRTDLFLEYRIRLFPLWHTSVEATVETITFVEHKTWRYQTLLAVHRFFDRETWKNKPFVLQVYSEKKPTFKVGDTIHCALDQINLPQGDFKLYLAKENIDATAFQSVLIGKVIKRPSFSFKAWIAGKKWNLHYRLFKKLPKNVFGFFSSLFLGNRNSVRQELEQYKPAFKNWGISHFIARSGLHLLVFIAIISALFQLIPLRFLLKQTFLVLCALLYFLFSWTSVSFNRAFYTFLFYKLTVLLGIPFHSMHAISLVCITILAHNPLQLFFLDFQLTFLLTFCLIWLSYIQHQRRLLYPQSIAELQKKKLL